MSPVGMLEALTGALGEADAEIGGLFQTRLTAAVSTGTLLAATLNWNGTTTITLSSTAELVAGEWVRLNTDGQYFQIASLVPNTSLTILNPYGRAIPTGTTTSSKAVTSFPVESTLDWEAAGILGVNGVRCHYTSKTDTAFQGVYHLAGGEVVPGAVAVLREQSPVIDLNRARTAIDLARRAMLVDYANGEDLNALARNLGVQRLPFLSGDTQFRAILKALAYNPKGTLYGLELALTGLVGAGNFDIYEDLIRYPNKVFIRLSGDAAAILKSQGKTYVAGPEYVIPTGPDEVTVAHAVADRGKLHGVFWKPEDLATDTRDAKPSAHMVAEYPGAIPTQAWRFYGANEATDVTLASPGIQFATAGDNRYFRQIRSSGGSEIDFEIIAKVPSGAGAEASISTVMCVEDGVRKVALLFQRAGTSTHRVGLGYWTGAVWAFSAGYVSYSDNVWRSFRLAKTKIGDTTCWHFYLSGYLVATAPYGDPAYDSATSERRVSLGVAGATTSLLTVKQIQLVVNDNTDLACLAGPCTRVSATQIDIGATDFIAGDAGKSLTITGSTAVNAQGGNNNGQPSHIGWPRRR
jgi:hypothetical protein